MTVPAVAGLPDKSVTSALRASPVSTGRLETSCHVPLTLAQKDKAYTPGTPPDPDLASRPSDAAMLPGAAGDWPEQARSEHTLRTMRSRLNTGNLRGEPTCYSDRDGVTSLSLHR